MLGSPANGTSLPDLRRNPVRHVAGPPRPRWGLAAQPPDLYLLWRNPTGQSVCHQRSAFPAPAAAASERAIQGQTCLGSAAHDRADGELDLSPRPSLTVSARTQEKLD